MSETTSRIDALQTALAGEHAAVYLYGVLGGRTSRTDSPRLYAAIRAAYTHHRSRRDHLTGLLADAGAVPTPAAGGYAIPPGIDRPRGARAAALAIEQAAAATYAFLVGEVVGDERAWATAALTDAAVRSLGFGGAAEPLPGL